jgi:hypothetical protein
MEKVLWQETECQFHDLATCRVCLPKQVMVTQLGLMLSALVSMACMLCHKQSSRTPALITVIPTVLLVCRYGALLQGCLAAGKPVLLVGGSGVGKSAVVKVRHLSTSALADCLIDVAPRKHALGWSPAFGLWCAACFVLCSLYGVA